MARQFVLTSTIRFVKAHLFRVFVKANQFKYKNNYDRMDSVEERYDALK